MNVVLGLCGIWLIYFGLLNSIVSMIFSLFLLLLLLNFVVCGC